MKFSLPICLVALAAAPFALVTGATLPLWARASTRAYTQLTCSPDQNTVLDAAIQVADTYIASAIGYMKNPNDGMARYTKWFGAYDPARANTILAAFTKLSGKPVMLTYDCNTCQDQGVYARVDPLSHPPQLCPSFWSAPQQGTNSKAGYIIGAMTRIQAYGGTKENAAFSTREAAMGLAASKPAAALLNTANWRFFAEDSS